MEKNEYIKTLNIAGKEILLGLDDYGQCYFVEWVDADGKQRSMGLGTYNFHYMEDIYYQFDPEYKELARKETRGEFMTPEEFDKWINYAKLFKKEYGIESEEKKMRTYVYSIDIAGNENITEDEKRLTPPIPLDYFPNNMGINLCSVRNMVWEEREDGQLVNIQINFDPNLDQTKEQALQDAKDYGLRSTTKALKKGIFVEEDTNNHMVDNLILNNQI